MQNIQNKVGVVIFNDLEGKVIHRYRFHFFLFMYKNMLLCKHPQSIYPINMTNPFVNVS